MIKTDNQKHSNQVLPQTVDDLLFQIIKLFSVVTVENYDETIQNVFSKVGKYCDLTWVNIYIYDQELNVIDTANEWCKTPDLSKKNIIKNMPLSALSDDFINLHTQGNSFYYDSVNQLQNDQKFSKALASQGISAMASESIIIDGHFKGYISFEKNKAHQWSQSEKAILKSIAHFLTLTMSKLDAQLKNIELERKIDLNNKSQGEFLYKMSHDIRTPLGGIFNAIYLLNSTNLSIEQKDFLEIGQASADVMSSIIDGVLDLSKIEAGNMELFHDMFNLEEELIRVYRVQKGFADEKGLDLIFDYDYDMNCELIGDYHKLRQILLTILSNAIKYTNEGFVKISTKFKKINSKKIVEIDIIDSGIGIDKDKIRLLNQAFSDSNHTGLDKFQNIGFGLSVSNELIRLMGGHLEIESTVNQGSIFKIICPFDLGPVNEYPFQVKYNALIISDELPYNSVKLLHSMGIKSYTLETIKNQKCDLIILDKEITDEKTIFGLKEAYGNDRVYVISIYKYEQRKLNSIHLIMEYPVSRKTFYQRLMSISNIPVEEITEDLSDQTILNGYALIVDDNRLNRIALESILTKSGMTSKSVNSGLNAINAVKNESFDIVLMDVQMPDMDGIETTRRIRSLGKNYESLPIIAVTANAFLSDYDFMKTSLMNDIILKPIRVKNLNLILRKYIKATTTIQIPIELFAFDQKDFEIRFEGSFDIADEVIESFLVEYKKDLQKIQNAVELGDAKKIIEATHYFKGSCSYLSGKRSVWLLSYMINAAKNQSLDMMQMCYELLEKEIASLLNEIDRYRK